MTDLSALNAASAVMASRTRGPFPHPRPAGAFGGSKPHPIDNLRASSGTAVVRHAMASKTGFQIALLVRRRTCTRKSGRLQNDPGGLHGTADRTAVPTNVISFESNKFVIVISI